MPAYHARSITVRLGSTSLAETITQDIVLRKGEVAKRQSEAAEKKLLSTMYLSEKRVLFPGDRDGFELNWLGNAPFMQVQVDPGITQFSGPDQDPRASERTRLQALTLHVKLSDESFLSGLSGKTHLKIEVLFNGQLSACSLIHTSDIRSGARSLHQIFAGCRVDFLAERPWVLLPPFTTADGGARRFRKTITPTERWQEVSAALMREAEERGTDKFGESPPSAAFLQALASMDMPECVKNMQKPGGRKFGTVDVIITAGFGNKLTTGTNYLKRPQRLGDSNFAMRTEIRSDEEVATAELDDSQNTTDRMSQEINSNATKGVVSPGGCCAHGEHARKRRVISPVEELPYNSPDKICFQRSHTHLMSGQPRPVLYTSRNNLSSTAGTIGPRCPSPEYRSDGHKEPLPVSDRLDTYAMNSESNNAQEYRSSLMETESRVLQTGFVYPALSGTQLPKSLICGLIGGSPSISNSNSSLITQAINCQAASLARPDFPPHVSTTVNIISADPSTPCVAPPALILPTPSDWSGPLDTMTSPCYRPMHFQQLQVGSYPNPGGLPSYDPLSGAPDLLPQTSPPFLGHAWSTHFARCLESSPPTSQLSRSLPPTAMFSVPSKPRRISSPDKGTATDSADMFQYGILVNRLVITGRGGKLIVDHLWNSAQRIVTNCKNSSAASVGFCAQTPTLERRGSDAGSGAQQQNGSQNKKTRILPRTESPLKQLKFNSSKQLTDNSRHDSVWDGQAEQTRHVPLPYLKKHQGPANVAMLNNQKIDVPDTIAPFVSARLMAASVLGPTPVQKTKPALSTQPTVSQRRSFARNSLPGIQGPKATTFLFDDPEEVLREAARMRRSRSPTKPTAMSPVPSLVRVQSTIYQDALGSSSPLSSVPSSTSSKKSTAVADRNDVTDPLPQLDGLSEGTLPALSPRKLQTPSPTKPMLATPKLQCPGIATLQTPISSNTKKRKASHQSSTRPPRSPDRLKTVDNPPLNDDCVIALAESVDKKEKRGVLRQIKGERQGVFKEEYVTLAVRFFVAGD